ncbi:MAG: transposase [Minisyncoccia bacterium]
MAKRRINFSLDEFYHLYNRGNSKQKIFLDEQDYDRFTKLLFLCNTIKSINYRDDIVEKEIDAWDYDKGESIVSIGAWVLIPNHFHILITTPPTSEVGEGSISFFMKKVCISYSKYFNKKYERVGGLFESNFKSSHIDDDNYLKYIFSYIHLNPVKKVFPNWKNDGILDYELTKEFLNKYEYSSYTDYINIKRNQSKILSIGEFPDYFSDTKLFKDEIFDWLSYTPTSDVGDNDVGDN